MKKTRKVLKTKLRGKIIAAACVLAVLCGTAGCVRQTETPIVAEKTEAPEGQEMPKGKEGALKDQETTLADGGTEVSEQEEGNGAPRNFIQEYSEAPRHYQANVREVRLTIFADAPLEIPVVSRIPYVGIENAPYEKEECENILKIFIEETGIEKWQIDDKLVTGNGMVLEPNSWVLFADRDNPAGNEYILLDDEAGNHSFTSEDGTYQLSLIRGEGSDGTPVMWLTNLKYTDGSNGGFDASDLSGCTLSYKERDDLEKVLEKKAEDCLRKFGIDNFYLTDTRWRRISCTENGGWEETGKYGLRLTYIRTVEGIPVFARNSGWASEALPAAQYIDFLYLEDSTLLRMKNINREKVVSDTGYADFLLPFDAVAQIFEQYMRYYQTVYEPELYEVSSAGTSGQQKGNGAQTAGTFLSSMEPHLYINVTGVKFGYQLQYDEFHPELQDKDSGRGRLVPVWAFYGTPSVGYDYAGDAKVSYTTPDPRAVAGENSLLITVNAEDGTIYGKK